MSIPKIPESKVDVVLVGAGVMSATLAVLLKELQPDLTIEIFEGLDVIAGESSNAWNNAGTGHAALCELNYTPQNVDGSVDIAKALDINEQFEVSKQFWTYLIESGLIESAKSFIHQVPHLSFVRGEENVEFLRKRHAALTESHLFDDMKFSEDRAEIAEWIPLVMEGRDPSEKIAATRVEHGSDVNFGALTKALLEHFQKQPGVSLFLRHKVTDVCRPRTLKKSSRWRITVEDMRKGIKRDIDAGFVFLGAGGGALPLLQKSGVPEGKGFGGFPVSGQWLRTDNPELVERHHAKVYGKASVGAPPMSVPHLDTRVIDGQKSLLFGPYAGFSTKYLKSGSLLDMPLAVRPDNLWPMLAAGRDNISLTKYLIEQVIQSPEQRLESLREFLPNVNAADWRLEIAGQRVQIIKKNADRGGILQFGTEVVASQDGSISALLGASPGASTAVSIMLQLIQRCFKNQVNTPEWRHKLKQMIPSYGESLAKDPDRHKEINSRVDEVLGLTAAPPT
ncbi:MAG TPA: malate dehydrogenase (quinone) [Chthoniobacterales bacterium]